MAKSVFTTTLMLLGGSLMVAVEETRVIFEEDFERYTNTAAMRAMWPQGAGLLELRAPGGGQAFMHGGGEANRRETFPASTTLLPAVGNSPPLTHEVALAELTAFAKQSLVQGLYEQRNALLDTWRKAEQALIEMEQRLAALHLPQQKRICACEDRIAELEKELETRDEDVGELTRAILLLVRRKLQEEKGLGRQRDQFN